MEDPGGRLQRFLADFRDLTSWVTEMKALINADELANDVAGAEALLDRHQEHKGEIDAHEDSFKSTDEAGQALLSTGHYASDEVREKEDAITTWTKPCDQVWTKSLHAAGPEGNNSKNMIVYVERKVLEDPEIANDESFAVVIKKFCTFREDYDDISDRVDFIICLGGDGTLLYASSLFQESVPPVMAFHLGSLGFLTPFNFDTYQSQVTQIIEGNAAIILRSRLKVKVVKEPREKKKAVQDRGEEKGLIVKNGESEISRRTVQYQVLNEVVVDRGPSSYLSNVDLFLDGHLITTVQGDGVIVSTPTGSTAYAVAAGASMIHPNVPAILITPICPHSLSFRPIVVPAGVELKIMLCPDARNTAWVSFDGRKRQEICHGDSLTAMAEGFA
ncbi:UNVERIFIED_CONTAM: hypothetical protein FKN15_057787 [Acipenser sinensis]